MTIISDQINRQSKIPYYLQLYEILRGKINQGIWQPGDILPTELVLIQTYQLSRNTVRQVLEMLVNDGVIYRLRGKGTFVAHPSLKQITTRITSFTEDMHQRGFNPRTRVLESILMPAIKDIADQLLVEAGEELAMISRLRLADGEPMSVEHSYLIHRLCPSILSHDFALKSLRQILERNYGIRLVRARQVIRALDASPHLANLLKIKKNSALLYIDRVSFSQFGNPVEFLQIYYRADRYSLYNELNE